MKQTAQGIGKYKGKTFVADIKDAEYTVSVQNKPLTLGNLEVVSTKGFQQSRLFETRLSVGTEDRCRSLFWKYTDLSRGAQ